MADITLLEGDGATSYRVVMHIPIPAGDNAVGLSWRVAVVRSNMGGTTVLSDGGGTLGTISAADKLLIESGALLEYVETVRLGSSPQDAVVAIYNERKTRKQQEVQDRLNQYGRNVSAP